MGSPLVVAVIQARMGSTRLPGKVLLEAAGEPVLGHVIRRVSAAAGVDRVVVATSTRDQDDPIVAAATAFGAETVRGSEDDVLGRFALAFDRYGGDVGVRVTADCPLFDPSILAAALRRFVEGQESLDYLSNTVVRTYPRGYDLEVFRVSALQQAAREARDASAREHVTPFLYRNPELFHLGVISRPDPDGTASWRLTLDTPDDWRLLRLIIDRLSPGDPLFGLEAVERFVQSQPEVLAWNQHIEQKAH